MAILVEETITEFGYNPNELTQNSKKRIVVACDECGKIRTVQKRREGFMCASCAKKGKRNGMFGKHLSEEACRHLREDIAHPKGKDSPRFGIHISDNHKKAIAKAIRGDSNPAKRPEVREKIRKSKIGEKNAMYGVCGDKHPRYGMRASEEEREAARVRRRKQKIPSHHTKPELIFEEICKNNNLLFHFVGDSQLWIGKEKKLNPDFCELNGKKIVVEIFGDYWHSPLQNPKIREGATLAFREKHYKKYGWKSVFVWENDLKRKDAEQFVLTLLKKEGAI